MGVIVRGSSPSVVWPRVTRTVVTPAGDRPVSLETAKRHSNIIVSDRDDLLGLYLDAAIEKVQNDTGTVLLTQTIDLVFDGFPSGTVLDLPIAPIQSVESVEYVDTDGDVVEVEAADYLLRGHRLTLADDAAWPTDERGADALTVRVVAGYVLAALVPASLREAVLIAFGWSVEPARRQFEQAQYDAAIGPHIRTLVA